MTARFTTGSRILHTLLVLLLAAVVLTTLPAAASAKSYIRSDPRGDVGRIDGEGDYSTAPDRPNGDIRRTVFRHMQQRVRVRVGFAALNRTFGDLFLTAIIETNKGLHREASVIVDHESGNTPWSGWSQLDNGDSSVRCSVHHSIDYAHDVVIIGVPRSCLHNPRWVRVGVNMTLFPPERPSPPWFYYEDNALVGVVHRSVDTPLSPRIFRG